MRDPSRPVLRSPFARAGAVSAILLLGLAGCVPGNLQISGVSFSVGSSGFGFGIGGLGGFPMGGGSGSSVALDDPDDDTRLMAATFHNPISCDERIGMSWGQGFLDFATGACYACPEGFSRADLSVPVDDPRACRQNSGNLYMAAESLGPQGCDVGTFQIEDACYSCPVDSLPSGEDDPALACIAAPQQTPIPVGAPTDPGTSVTFN